MDVDPNSTKYSLLVGESALYPSVNCVRLRTNDSRPRSNIHSLSMYGKVNTVSLIAILLIAICPAAIFRTVSKGVIFAFERHAVRASPDIREEVEKNHPSLTNRDPSAAVVRISRVVDLGASSYHCSPCDVFLHGVEPVLDLTAALTDDRFSFIHNVSMFGVSEPPATTGGFRVWLYETSKEKQVWT